MSEYRFRGLTQSDEAGAVQATLNLNSTTGFYVGSFISSIDDKVSLPGYGASDKFGGQDVRLRAQAKVLRELLTHLGIAKPRSEEHTSELQSLMRTSYAVFCLKKKQHN